MSVSLFVDVWGTYFRQILSDDWIASIARNCGCEFKECVACINNIPEELFDECDDLIVKRLRDGSLRRTLSIAHADIYVNKLNLKVGDFPNIPYQSLADLVAISDCETDHIVFFSGDSVPWGKSNWVNEGIKLLEENPGFMIVNPTWNGFYDHSHNESFSECEDYYLGRGFSDQCYLARTADLKADIYHEKNPMADLAFFGPHGNTFEKRVNAYMRNHGKVRVTLKSAAYITRP